MTNSASDPVDDLLEMQAQDGDRGSMEELVRRWQKRLWSQAYRLTARSDAAWDITQQAWLEIIRGLGRLHDPARLVWVAIIKVIAWLLTARNSTSREVKRLEIRLSDACEAWRHQPNS